MTVHSVCLNCLNLQLLPTYCMGSFTVYTVYIAVACIEWDDIKTGLRAITGCIPWSSWMLQIYWAKIHLFNMLFVTFFAGVLLFSWSQMVQGKYNQQPKNEIKGMFYIWRLILDGPDNYAMSKKQASLLIRDQKKNLVKILATKPFKERLFLRVFSLSSYGVWMAGKNLVLFSISMLSRIENVSVISIKRQINRLINGESRQQSSLLQQW